MDTSAWRRLQQTGLLQSGCYYVILTILIFFNFTILSWASGGDRDILTPEERLWLTQNQSRLVLAVETGYAPFVFVDSAGRPSGLASDYMTMVESKLGIHFNQKQFSSLNEIFEKIRDRQVHIANAITKTAWRSTFLNITDSFVSVPNVIITSKDKTDTIDENRLTGLTVSLVKSYAITECITAKGLDFTARLVADDLTALLDVSFGRSDAAIIDLATASYLISGHGITNLRVAGQAALPVQLSMAASLDEPILYTILQKGLGAMTQAERQAIHNRWINASGPDIFADPRFWVYAGSGLAVVLTLIAGILFWNHALRRQVILRTNALAKEKAEYHQELERQIAERTAELSAANSKLHQMSERLTLATSGTHIGIWDFDVVAGTCVYDHQMLRLYGLVDREASFTLTDWQSCLHPEDRERATADIYAALRGEQPLDTEFRILRSDGAISHLKSMAQVYRDQMGHPIRMVGISYDITDRKRLQDSLRERMLELNVILDNSSVGIAFVKDRRQIWSNKRMSDLFGYAHTEMQNEATRKFYITENDYNDLGMRAYPILEQGQRYVAEQRMRRYDGSHIWVRMSGQAITGDLLSGGSIWTFEDVTSQKQSEQELRLAKEAADAANKAKSEFLAMMSHEIRTPITGVLGMADLLRRTSINDEQVGYLDTLAASTKTLLTVLNDILDISKIEAGKVVFEAVEFSVHDAVHETLALFRAGTGSKVLSLSHDIAVDLPSPLIGDPVRFKQILFNLTGNAVKFTESGGVHLRLSVKTRHGDAVTVLVEIQDTGMGIAADQLPLLFQPFSQLGASTSRRFGGTGLGLVITKRLVEMMGGAIGVDSVVARGTRFWFTLPLRVAPPRAVPASGRSAAARGKAARPLRILLAEDNRINQMLVQTMLQKIGHTVEVADNGRVAVAAIMARDFDVVLMDMQMPEMGGEDATRAVRALPAPKNTIPVLALTADAMPEQRDRYLAAGINDLVPKPIDWDVLLAALNAHTRTGETG